ncbi:MAG TPA: histidine kinase [Prolixibacteraceae bacterium]|nr:histidine kinase [Prolixibacteraceae bacterium]HPS12450.1 histidine kinase [Prolixibacteraceae bacterium]
MNRIIKIILHLFYWMVFCLFGGAVSFHLTEGLDFIRQNIIPFIYNLGWAMVQFYLFYFFFYRLIEKQRYIFYFILSVLVSLAVGFVLVSLYPVFFNVDLNFVIEEYLPSIAGSFIIAQTGSLLRGFIRWFEDIQQKQEIEKVLMRNELDMLNAQLNPHFLFNTLNNIDSLIRSNPDKASESLITLSEIMRYMLYDAKKPKVSLMGEIAHYQNIIRLQLLRLKDPGKVEVKVEVENEVEVAPLLFLPFIENAFKYAVFDDPGAKIGIVFKSEGGKIEFRCSNPYLKNDLAAKAKTGGIGLSNLKRRLELLYKGKYTLDIQNRNSYFSVHLIIEP